MPFGNGNGFLESLNTVSLTVKLPTFQCKKCGKKIRDEYERCVTGDERRNLDKAPFCCGQPMMETIDD